MGRSPSLGFGLCRLYAVLGRKRRLLAIHFIALLFFMFALEELALLYGKFRKPSFCKLVATFPERALEHISKDPTLVVPRDDEPEPRLGFAKPSLLAAPSVGKKVPGSHILRSV